MFFASASERALTARMKPYGPRAPDGTAEVRVPIRMPKQLHRQVSKLAKAAGVTVTEWIRQAIRERVAAQSG